MKKLLVLLALTFVAISFAAKAPTHRSIRAEAMGNAHVALVDDKEAIYFNYAGLNQINRLGNYDMRPEQGYYPRNIGDMRLNLGGAGPFETYFSTYNVAKDGLPFARIESSSVYVHEEDDAEHKVKIPTGRMYYRIWTNSSDFDLLFLVAFAISETEQAVVE